MTNIKNCSPGTIAVNVPGDAINIKLANRGEALRYNSQSENKGLPFDLWLPPGDWTILLDTSKVSEEDAKRVVGIEGEYDYDTNKSYYKNYTTGEPEQFTVLDSFATYKTFYGIDEGRWILLENKNR
jgi:hypothetical protein